MLQAASCKLQAASCKLQAASCKLQAASRKLQAANRMLLLMLLSFKKWQVAFGRNWMVVVAEPDLLRQVGAGLVHVGLVWCDWKAQGWVCDGTGFRQIGEIP